MNNLPAIKGKERQNSDEIIQLVSFDGLKHEIISVLYFF